MKIRYLPPLAALLLLMATVQILSMRQEAQTFDEGIHLVSGYSYWKTGQLRLNPEHPPLGKWLNALPILLLNPKLPVDHPSWKSGNDLEIGRQFLYYNTVPADTLLGTGIHRSTSRPR